MKLYLPVFSGRQLEFTLMYSPRRTKAEIEKEGPNTDKPLLMRNQSKVGNQYLTFNPTVGLTIQSRQNKEARVVVPGHLIYQMAGIMYRVYQTLSEDNDWTIRDPDGGERIVVAEEVRKRSRKMSLFKTTIIVEPTLVPVMDEGLSVGVNLIFDRILYGNMIHYEVKSLIDTINHMDMTTLGLLSGLTDRVDTMDQKLDAILAILQSGSV